jgi:hypothetical protein
MTSACAFFELAGLQVLRSHGDSDDKGEAIATEVRVAWEPLNASSSL